VPERRPDAESLLALAEKVAAAAEPGEQLEAFVARHQETDVRAYDGEVESLSVAESAGIGVRVVRDGRQGFAWVANLSEQAAAEALSEARDNARFATPDEHAGLVAADGVAPAPLELWHEELVSVPTEDKVQLALELERRTRAADPRVRQVPRADYGDALGEAAIATSAGIRASSRKTVCYVGTEAVAGDGPETQNGYGYSVGRHTGEIDLERAVQDAVERATRMLGAKKPQSRTLTVVLEPRVTAALLGIVSGTLSGEEVLKDRSFFAGRLGEQVAAPQVHLVDDPTNPLAFGASVFDAEGLACRANTLIEGGRLAGFLYDGYAGRRAGTASTGSAVRAGFRSTPGTGARAVALAPGELDAAQIYAAVGEGLLVQSVTGIHSGVNPVSGDFSVGAEGLMIRDGALAEPVRELTIASSLQKMLQGISHIGSDLAWLPSVASGMTLAIEDMAMSGA
jgi:PmbA protein